MELIKELFQCYLKKMYHDFCELEERDFEGVIDSVCFNALSKIKEIIRNDELSDRECFEKIEAIVCLFEEMGIDGANRHDF